MDKHGQSRDKCPYEVCTLYSIMYSTEVRSSYDKRTPMTEDLECQLKVRDMWNLIWFNGIDIHVWLPVPSGDSAK